MSTTEHPGGIDAMLRFMDSFAAYTTAYLSQRYDAVDPYSPGATTIVNTASTPTPLPRTGTQRAQFAAYSALGKILPSAPTALLQGAAFYDANVTSGHINALFVLTDVAGNPMIGLYATSTGALVVKTLGAAGYSDAASITLGTSAAGALARSAYTMVEWVVTAATGATGSVIVSVAGAIVLNLTNVVTANTALKATSNTIGYAYLGSPLADGSNASLAINDYYIADTTGAANTSFLGDVRIQAIYPAGAGRQTAWALNGSAGSNYASVNTSPPGTNFVASNVIGAIDAYALGALPPTTTVKAVQVSINASKDNSNARSIGIGVGNGTTEAIDAGRAQSTTAKYYTAPLDTNPLTSAAWATADFSTLQAAIKVTA